MTSPSSFAVFLTVIVTVTFLLSQGACKHHQHPHSDHHHSGNHHHHHHHQHQQHRLRHGSDRGCSKCAPGSGVASACRVDQDTTCRPCLQGSSYSAHHSYLLGCLPCSRCGQGLYIDHPCTIKHDTLCDSCATVRGPRNCDFYAKCPVETWNETLREPESVSGDVNVTSCSNVTTTRADDDDVYREYGDGHDPRDVTTTESDFEATDGFTKTKPAIIIKNTEYKKSASTKADLFPTEMPWTFSDGVLGPTTATAESETTPRSRYVTVPADKLPMTSPALSSSDATTPLLLSSENLTKDHAGITHQRGASTTSSSRDVFSQSATSTGDDVDLEFLTALMARETWDHSKERYEDSPQVAQLLSRALKDQSGEEHRLADCTRSNKNGCHSDPVRSAKSEFAHRMEEWHKLDALNTFQVAVIVAVTCAIVISAFWVVLQCRKARTAVVSYNAVDSDEEYV